MLSLKYANFTDLFLDINKKIIEEPETYVENINWNQCYLPFSVFECDTCDCNINLSELCYTANKIKILSRTYINKDTLERFKAHLRVCKGTSLTYYFNNTKPKQGTTGNNGPCIISIVFTKKYRNDKYFTEANIYYRTTEINRRFYADLVLFNLFMKEMPEDLIKVEKFRIIIPKAFLHTKNLLFNLNLFKIDLKIDNEITRQIKHHLSKFEEHGLYNYKSIQRIQLHLNNELIYDPVNMEALSI